MRHDYVSEIVIVNTHQSIIERKVFFVNFNKIGKDGFYLDKNDSLKSLWIKQRHGVSTQNIDPNNIVDKLHPTTFYFCFIKIIKDIQNPQLEGEIILFRFSRKIMDIITNSNQIGKTLLLNMTLTLDRYLNYDKTCFTNNSIYCTDYNLDLNKEIFFKQLDINSLVRKEKLNNINEN